MTYNVFGGTLNPAQLNTTLVFVDVSFSLSLDVRSAGSELITLAGSSRCVGRVISGVRDFVMGLCVCVCPFRKKDDLSYQHQTW